jgi:Tfp pilus assembly protein PilN
MRLRLNLSTTPSENNRPFLAGAALAGTLGLLALAVLSHAALGAWQANRSLRTEITHWQEEIQVDRQSQQVLKAYFQTPAAQRVLDRAAFLNSLIGERSFPWTKIFMDLEQTLPAGVRVVNISPKLVNGRAQVELEVGATSDEGKIRFLEAIEKSKVFSGLQVKQERRVEQTGSSDKVILTLSVWYTTT